MLWKFVVGIYEILVEISYKRFFILGKILEYNNNKENCNIIILYILHLRKRSEFERFIEQHFLNLFDEFDEFRIQKKNQVFLIF